MKLRKAMFAVIVCACLVTPTLSAQTDSNDARDAALKRLQDSAGGMLVVSKHKSTGAARFIRLQPEASARLGITQAPTKQDKQAQSLLFFRNFGAALGVSDANELRFHSEVIDQLGETHLTWKQFHGGVPVFAGTIKTHFDASNQLKAVAGTAIPDISVKPTPTWESGRAAEVARNFVISDRGNSNTSQNWKENSLRFSGRPGERCSRCQSFSMGGRSYGWRRDPRLRLCERAYRKSYRQNYWRTR